MGDALVKTHRIPMLAKPGATPCVAFAARLEATGTWCFSPVLPVIGIDQTKVKAT